MHTGQEAISFMSAGLAMIFLAAVMVFVIRNASVGKEFMQSAENRIENATNQVMSGTFSEITHTPKTLPASGAYALIGYNESFVKEIVCKICDPNGKRSNSTTDCCLKDHLTGDVIVSAQLDQQSGQYTVTIESMLYNAYRAAANSNPMKMPTSQIKSILTAHKHVISSVRCNVCGATTDAANCCLFKERHKAEMMYISPSYNSSTKKYSVTIYR